MLWVKACAKIPVQAVLLFPFQSLYQTEPADKKIKLPSAFWDGGIPRFCLTNKCKVKQLWFWHYGREKYFPSYQHRLIGCILFLTCWIQMFQWFLLYFHSSFIREWILKAKFQLLNISDDRVLWTGAKKTFWMKKYWIIYDAFSHLFHCLWKQICA